MIRSTCRIAITLGLIAVSVIWIAHGMKLIPDPSEQIVKRRLQVCDSLAVTTSWFAQNGTHQGLDDIVKRIGERSADVESIRVMRGDYQVAGYGQHPGDWSNATAKHSSSDRMAVEILANGQTWGRVQVSFYPMVMATGFQSLLLIFFCGALVVLLSWFFLNRTLTYLNPSRVVPNRVRNALDVITDGLVLQDKNQQIVMTNQSFSEIVGQSSESLMGGSPDDFGWQETAATDHENGMVGTSEMPWREALRTGEARRGVMVARPDEQGKPRKYVVNSTPLLEENGQCRGALTSFQDVTVIEDKREELSRMLQILKKSRDEIRRQNENLQFLASRDSLTGCLNRRSFFEHFLRMWNDSPEAKLSVVMTDIDKFKAINDNYGHSVGDQVIKMVARIIQEVVDEQGVVCRYGGEEFCIALPHTGFDEAFDIAEQIRVKIESEPIAEVSVTTSAGVSSRDFLAMDPQHMVEQADQSLYAAKNRGRNQVVGWDTCAEADDSETLEQLKAGSHGDTAGLLVPIDPHVLSSLFSTLYYRDQNTALHSARVANLASHVAKATLDESVRRVIETAALMHDIGKIGVPDRVLNKPTGLDGLEKHLMGRRDSIARAICRSAQVSNDVTVVLESFQRFFNHGRGFAEMSKHQPRLSFCCRVIAICDAFDSMVHFAEYRQSHSIDGAIRELRQAAGEQFDPEIVERFVDTIQLYPEALLPLQIEGADLDDSFMDETFDVFAIAEAGNLEPLRKIMKRLKRHALLEDDDFQQSIVNLETSLNQNDEQIKQLAKTTRELLDLCHFNQQQRSAVDDYQPFQ